MADWHLYVDALCSEFSNRIEELAWPLRTVYFGGGTPSLMPEEEFLRLCRFLRPYVSDAEEFTMEVNPDDVDAHMLGVWKDGGVNRLSLGVQTFCDGSLKSIGRRHDSASALKAYSLARNYFENVSVDLMFGLPGQTLDLWRRDLSTVLQLRPEHISAYSLMYEEGTVLTALRDRGRIEEVSEDLSERMFVVLIEELSKAGYDHYEISNFAVPGHRSRHNSSYWLQKPYLGLGPSAHSYDGFRTRKANMADLRGYVRYWTQSVRNCGSSGMELVCEEYLSDLELIEEYVMTRLRMREGIPVSDFKERFGAEALSRLADRCGYWGAKGMMLCHDSGFSLSEKAVLISDSVILDLASLF